MAAYQFYSAPSSAHPSRAASPILASRRFANNHSYTQDEPAYANAVGNSQTAVQFREPPQPQHHVPQILKMIPPEGPINGGIEVTILGTGFTKYLEVMFGEIEATATTFWSNNLLVCMLPPSPIPGPVAVSFKQSHQTGFASQHPLATNRIFTYVDDQEQQVYELAFRLLYGKQCNVAGGSDYRSAAQNIVAQSRPWAGVSGLQSMPGMQGRHALNTEELVLRCLEIIDMDDSPREPDFEMRLDNGATLLSLACSLGYTRVVAGLLARKAHPDTCISGGFTPLMLAAMRGHTAIVRRLLIKGADPTLRTHRGYVAADFTPSREVLRELMQMQPRLRADSTSTPVLRSRANSIASNWELSSASRSSSSDDEVESREEDIEEVEMTVPWMHSRRSSAVQMRSRRNSTAHRSGEALGLVPSPAQEQANPFSAVGMAAWRDSLANQINQFQQNMNLNFPNFQLPALPPMPNLPDYQPQAMVRRISSLMPNRIPSRTGSRSEEPAAPAAVPDSSWRDWFSGQPVASVPPLASSPPPAYDEIYPDRNTSGGKTSEDKKMPELTAIAEAVLDQKCVTMFEEPETKISATPSCSIETLQTVQPRKTIRFSEHRIMFWIPLLIALLAWATYTYCPQAVTRVSAIAEYIPHHEDFAIGA